MNRERVPKFENKVRSVCAVGAAGFFLTACSAETDYCTEPFLLSQTAVQQSVTGKEIKVNGELVKIDYSTQAVLGQYPERELSYLRVDDGDSAAEAWMSSSGDQPKLGAFEMDSFRVVEATGERLVFACN